MNIDVLVEKISEKLKDHQTQQVSASNSTLLSMIQDLSKEVKENTGITLETRAEIKYISDKVKSIEEQTKKTNGRVTHLESKQGVQSGIIKAIIFVVPILITLISYIFNSSINQLKEYGQENRKYINELKEK